MGLAHAGIGLFVHFRGSPWLYFVYPPDQPHGIPLRHDLFGISNHLGLLGAILLLVLLAISNDYALRRMGRLRWKALQRWNYVAFVLVLMHGAGYQIVEERPLPYVMFFAAAILITLAVQGAGFRSARRGIQSRSRA